MNAVTKNILTTQPENIFRLVNRPPFPAVKQGHIPLKDVFDAWLQEQLNHAYFFAMKQIGKHLYIGQEIPTESLRQRFHNLQQKRWNPVTRKNEYLLVNEFHNEFLMLLNETNGMDPATVLIQVPELAALFYHGLIP